jgi:hypothetical protein
MNKPNMMNAAHQSANGRSPLDILFKQAPVVTGMLALGVGLTAAGDANAALVVTDINVTIPQDGTGLSIDLDGDLTNDFRIQTNVSDPDWIQAQVVDTKSGNAVSLLSFSPTYTSMLGAGDTVDASWFNGDSGFSGLSFGNLVGFDGNGPWSLIGAHGFLGLQLDLADGIHYGWLEVTHGSVIVGQMGYQTTANAGASIVPLPASLPLLASGFAGLMALRCRRRKVADET